jgi:hypothetical protein
MKGLPGSARSPVTESGCNPAAPLFSLRKGETAMNRSPSEDHPHAPSLTEADVPPRRQMLRGMLAAGCSLLLPASLQGCDSGEKAGSPETGSAPSVTPPESAAPAGPAPEMEAAAPAAPAKVSQASVQYQTQPKGEQKCADCMHFIAESNTCKLVEGEISPDGWCVLWARKA